MAPLDEFCEIEKLKTNASANWYSCCEENTTAFYFLFFFKSRASIAAIKLSWIAELILHVEPHHPPKKKGHSKM